MLGGFLFGEPYFGEGFPDGAPPVIQLPTRGAVGAYTTTAAIAARTTVGTVAPRRTSATILPRTTTAALDG